MLRTQLEIIRTPFLPWMTPLALHLYMRSYTLVRGENFNFPRFLWAHHAIFSRMLIVGAGGSRISMFLPVTKNLPNPKADRDLTG
jgi:hypothetical protein